jgi:hypothetical protein
VARLNPSRLESVKLCSSHPKVSCQIFRSSNTYPKLTCIDIRMAQENSKDNRRLLRKLASTSSAQLLSLCLRLDRGVKIDKILPRVAKVTKHHSATLKEFKLLFPDPPFDPRTNWLNPNTSGLNDVEFVCNQLLDLFGIPAHRIRLHQDWPIFRLIIESSWFEPVRVDLWEWLFNQFSAPSLTNRAKDVIEIIRDSLPPRKRAQQGRSLLRSDFIEHVVEVLVESEEYDYHTSLRLLAALALRSAYFQSQRQEVLINQLLQRHKEDVSRVVSIILLDCPSRQRTLTRLLARPMWNRLILNHCNSKESVLLQLDIGLRLKHYVAPLLGPHLDLRTTNVHGCTLIDIILRYKHPKYTEKVDSILGALVYDRALRKKLLQHVAAPQVPSSYSTVILRKKKFPPFQRCLEICRRFLRISA